MNCISVKNTERLRHKRNVNLDIDLCPGTMNIPGNVNATWVQSTMWSMQQLLVRVLIYLTQVKVVYLLNKLLPEM